MILLIFTLGLLFGSFITMASYRLPRGQDWIIKRSYCPQCNHTLHIRDLIPLFSWIRSNGACHYCHHSISVRYPIIEIITACLFVLPYLRFPMMIHSAIWLLLLYWLTITLWMIMSVITLEKHKIPKIFYALLAGLGIISNLIIGINFTFIIQNILFAAFISIILYGIAYFLSRYLHKPTLVTRENLYLFLAIGCYLSPALFLCYIALLFILVPLLKLGIYYISPKNHVPAIIWSGIILLFCLLFPREGLWLIEHILAILN